MDQTLKPPKRVLPQGQKVTERTISVAVQKAPDVIVAMQLAPETVQILHDRYGVRDLNDPVALGLAITRLLKDEMQRRAQAAKQQE